MTQPDLELVLHGVVEPPEETVRRLAQVQGKEQTHEALLDIAAICMAWSERLIAQGAVTMEQAA